MAQPRIEIISGPSCVGKSVYLDRHAGAHDGLLFLDRADVGSLREDARYLVHYNLLRPFDAPRLRLTRFETYWRTPGYHLRKLWRGSRSPFEMDRPLVDLLARPATFHATVLVAPLPILLQRLRGRDDLEPLLDDVRDERYETSKWERVYRSIDLERVYRQWLAFLIARGIETTLIDSRGSDYSMIADEDEMLRLLAQDRG